MNDQQHLIFGAGLIGGYLAGCLMHKGYSVNLVARPSTQKAFAKGLTISDYLGNLATVPTPTFIGNNDSQSIEFDYIWLTVKCTAVEACINDLAQFISADTTIICCQNGLGSETVVEKAFPKNRILRAVVGFNVAEPKTGHLHRSTEGKLCIETAPQIPELRHTLHGDLLPVTESQDIVAEQWAKLQLNLANPVNALADIPVKAMTENTAYRKIIAALMDELLAVAHAMQLDLPKLTAVPARWLPKMLRLPNPIFKLLAQKMLAIDPTARLSMWWDLSNGKTTEIDYLNQAVVSAGENYGINCQANRRLVRLIKEVETGSAKIGMSAGQIRAWLYD